jgi:hypothetical protein
LLKKIAQRPEKIAQNVAQPFCYQSWQPEVYSI